MNTEIPAQKEGPNIIHLSATDDLACARKVLELASAGLNALSQSLDDSFIKVIDLLQSIEGRVVVSGMGKSGHVARKMSSTFASTGIPSFFVHPGEASHGDLGMIDQTDAVIAISNSGETPEMSNLIGYTRRFKIPLIVITSKQNSNMADQADAVLFLPKAEEACPLGLAPTTSTTMAMALGDTLAVVLMDRLGFTADDFKLRHPGGQLGKRLLKVSDIMHRGAAIPKTYGDVLMSEVLPEMTLKSFGCIAIVDDRDQILGVITDGDLRRRMEDNILTLRADQVMTAGPKTIRPTALAIEAVQVMNDAAITNLFVAENNKIAGVIHIHDCLRAGVE